MLTVEVKGFDELRMRLNAAKGSVIKSGAGFAIGEILRAGAVKRLARGKQSPEGQKWAALSPAYAAFIQLNGIKGSLLYRSGLTAQSVGYNLVQWPKGIIILTANTNYAGYLQKGTKKMPARPFLGVSEAEMADIKSTVSARFKGALEGR